MKSRKQADGARRRATRFIVVFASILVLFQVLFVVTAWTQHHSHCSADHAAFWTSDAWRQVLDKTVAILVLEPSVYILIPGLIWLAVSFPLASLREFVSRDVR